MDNKQTERLKAEREKAQMAIQQVKTEIEQLENQNKVLLSKRIYEERRQRNHRLIERGAMLESAFPALKRMGNGQVQAFLIAVSRLPSITELLAKATQPSDTG